MFIITDNNITFYLTNYIFFGNPNVTFILWIYFINTKPNRAIQTFYIFTRESPHSVTWDVIIIIISSRVYNELCYLNISMATKRNNKPPFLMCTIYYDLLHFYGGY